MKGTLYLVGTPIGNMGDLSPRAVETLSGCDLIAAEDTRVSGKLLSLVGIKKPMISYFEHNKAEHGELILNRLLQGESVALVTDAGMPAISDPGEDLVALCVQNGITVKTAPGPTAALSALAMSGLSTQRFCFEGFLTVNKAGRKAHLGSLTDETRTMIFYEAPHKLRATLMDLHQAFGDRKITLCREMTKLYEENIYTTLAAAQELYSEANPPKGEFVLVIEGKTEEQSAESEEERLISAADFAEELIRDGASLKDASKLSAVKFEVAKNAVYSLLVDRKNSI